jgi:hypothetical protein
VRLEEPKVKHGHGKEVFKRQKFQNRGKGVQCFGKIGVLTANASRSVAFWKQRAKPERERVN